MAIQSNDWRTDRTAYDETHGAFREQVARFFAEEMEAHGARWEREGATDRALWQRAGRLGLLAAQVPEDHGGPGLDHSFNFVVTEELSYAAAPNGFQTHSDVCVDYLLHYANDDLRKHWLPRCVDGSGIGGIALTEPGAGSDLRGMRSTLRRDGDTYVLNGAKTYISNGQNADFLIVAGKTEVGGRDLTLVFVESDRAGVRRGRNLDKIGHHGADTSELFFDDVRVPVQNRLGAENGAMTMLVSQLPQERLSIAVSCQASAQRAYDEAVRFVRDRVAFGRTILDFQNTRFVLADLKTQLQVGWAHLDWAIARHMAGRLTADEAAAAKLWHSESLWRIVDASLQLHGGAGYMDEYPISRIWRDARVMRIYGGTSEIMKEVVGRTA
jgi:acyl-CoA dehydrogenase